MPGEAPTNILSNRDDHLANLLLSVGIGDDIRYDHWAERWHYWDGHRWRPDQERRVYDLVRDYLDRLWPNAKDNDQRKSLLPLYDWAKKTSVLATLSARKGIAMRGDEWDHVDHLLGVANGVVDLRTGRLADGDPTDLVSKSTGVVYDPARHPSSTRFEQFLREVYVTPEMVAYMKRAVGALLVGGHMKAFLMLLGDTDTGKSVMVGTLAGLLGEYACPLGIKSFAKPKWQAPSNSHTRDLMHLPGSRFVYAVESDDQTTLDVARLKAMTGGEPQLLAGAYSRHERAHRVTWKVWLGTNTPPRVTDESDATWQRMQSIPHTVRFWRGDDPARPAAAPRQDPDLPATLLADLPGILTMAVGWAREYLEGGLLPLPQAARDLRAELQQDDEIAAWFEFEMAEDPSASITAHEAFLLYQHWCSRSGAGSDQVSETKFGKLLRKRARDKTKAGGGAWRYVGIRRATSVEMSG